MKNDAITVAITGASGSIYAIRLVEALLKYNKKVNLLITEAGFLVMNEETGFNWRGDKNRVNEQIRAHFRAGEELIYYDNSNFYSPLASGSSGRGTMIICPCSMGTLGRIASGISGNLLERAADVVLKERGNLIIVARETPLNDIHLENMLKLSRMDARIVPAMPAFYQKPETIEDLVDFVVGKVLDQVGVEHDLFKRWGS
ncbi:MAG: UbiX family flavin prenyltransferase [Deltaproteobacteria bacterium]|nr:UbiX family flavin prenyltransferase [Deltaproteobacteria bacterium]